MISSDSLTSNSTRTSSSSVTRTRSTRSSNRNSTNTTPVELLKQLIIRFSTIDTVYFLSLIILNIIIGIYLIKDNDFSNSILLTSFDNEIVQSMGTLGTCCIIMVTIRSILESIDSDEINRYFKETSVSLDDAVVFNLILSFSISAPLLSMSLSYSKAAFYILFDASVSFNITCGLSMICCIKASQRNISRYFYHIICGTLLISRLLFIRSINSNNTFPISVANSLQAGSMVLY